MHIAEVVTIAKSLPLLRLNTYKSLILSYSADYRRILQKKRYNLVALATLLNGIQIVSECVLSFSMLRIQNIFGNLPLLVNKVGRALLHDFN